MQSDGLPFAIKFFLLLAIFGLGFLLARDLFFIMNGSSDQHAAAASSPVPTKTKSEITSSDFSKQPFREEAGEAATTLRQDPAKNPVVNNPQEVRRPLELGNTPSKGGLNAKPLRADEGRLPTGDLRTGSDAKPMGSLRSPTESSVNGSLRPNEHSLPTGSLRADEGSLPGGSLR